MLGNFLMTFLLVSGLCVSSSLGATAAADSSKPASAPAAAASQPPAAAAKPAAVASQPAAPAQPAAVPAKAAPTGAAMGTPCEEVKAGIDAKLKAKGVKAFTLEAVPAENVKDAKVVGSCEGGRKKITYKRG